MYDFDYAQFAPDALVGDRLTITYRVLGENHRIDVTVDIGNDDYVDVNTADGGKLRINDDGFLTDPEAEFSHDVPVLRVINWEYEPHELY